MNVGTMLSKWKQSENDANAMANVAGAPVINEELLRGIQGGGSGFVPSISAECNGGTRCDNWEYWWQQL